MFVSLDDEAWGRVVSALDMSPREAQIAFEVFRQRTEADIARVLGISVHTVHSHLERLYHKLGVCSRVDLVLRIVTEHLSSFSAREPATAPRGRPRRT